MSVCPSCGQQVPARSFCANCGASLGVSRRGEERRVVTTLFCDLVGFTALSERHDAEIVDSFLRRYYGVARRVVESYGGTVEKFIGDAVVAVFGVPAVHEDDPERAVRAGLRLVDEIDALPGIAGQAVEVRVGVNTGEALVRLGVDPSSGQGFLTGDAVNVAARLQSAAPPMAVAVGEATHAATEKIFSFDACHPVTLKGKSKPLAAWIANASLARTGSELRSFSSSFVGREEELVELQGLLDAASESCSPRFALICGEPGIGKSRLLAEFARRLDDRPAVVTWRQGRCLPFGSGVTFWALSEIVKAQAGILESDGVARSEARLETVLPDGEDRDRLRGRLRPLIGLEAEEASREDNFAAWREFLEGLAADRPTVLVVEDLHWADHPMLAFMDFLAQSEASVPLLVLATARPEVLELDGPGAGFVAAATQVAVGPLSGEETAELARARLGARSLPTDLQALILERSGGNPLFAEELVRLLEDRDLLDSRGGKVSLKPGVEVPMPDSIGSLIAARLDLLTADRKALLSDAAVVGRSFWAGAVAAVGPHDPAEVFEGLHELVAKELVRPERGSSMEGETEFLFVHALVCDVAYEQLTRADRAAKHAALARWLEQRTAGRTEDLAEILAYHYGTALEMATAAGLDDLEDELSEPTTRYLEMAGGRAAPLDAAAAAAHFARAERVADEAAKPKRRWLLSRRTRRTLEAPRTPTGRGRRRHRGVHRRRSGHSRVRSVAGPVGAGQDDSHADRQQLRLGRRRPHDKGAAPRSWQAEVGQHHQAGRRCVDGRHDLHDRGAFPEQQARMGRPGRHCRCLWERRAIPDGHGPPTRPGGPICDLPSLPAEDSAHCSASGGSDDPEEGRFCFNSRSNIGGGLVAGHEHRRRDPRRCAARRPRGHPRDHRGTQEVQAGVRSVRCHRPPHRRDWRARLVGTSLQGQ